MSKQILKASLFLVFVFLYTNSYSQSVGNVPLKDIDAKYIEVVGTSKFMSTKITVTISYGQKITTESVIRDEKGSKIAFNSMVHAINFLSDYGYVLDKTYAITVSNQNVYHYLMKKEE